jgi:condensin complex subunit 1
MVVALGDHAFRFPNEVEPYTPRLYACLRDGSTTVRRHTLMVLTHLILNDMVKVKGQVCEIAMCLQDDDPRIRDMSRLLFHELSKRSNNPVYNLLPDIISQLSQQSLKKEEFRSIMSFLLAFIKKERQNEMLVEKLCHRFPNCKSISQKADLAFCIAQLKVNDRAIKCLSDLFKLYKDALFDEDVRKSFASVVSKAKKFAKPEIKECLEEWEAKLNEHGTLGEENQRAGKKAVRAKARAKKRATRKKRLGVELDDDELSFVSDGGDVENKENQRSALRPPRRGRRIAQAIEG